MFILFQLFSDILSIYNLRLAIVFSHFSDANKKSLWVIMSGFFSNQTQLLLLPLSCQYLISQPYQMHFLMVKEMLAIAIETTR